jgi:hypothetical protein
MFRMKRMGVALFVLVFGWPLPAANAQFGRVAMHTLHPAYQPHWGCFGYCDGPLPYNHGPYYTCYGYCPPYRPYHPHYTCYGYCPKPNPPYWGCYGYCPGPITQTYNRYSSTANGVWLPPDNVVSYPSSDQPTIPSDSGPVY